MQHNAAYTSVNYGKPGLILVFLNTLDNNYQCHKQSLRTWTSLAAQVRWTAWAEAAGVILEAAVLTCESEPYRGVQQHPTVVPLGEPGGHEMTLLLPIYLILMLDDILKTSLFFQIQKLKILVFISPCKWNFSTPRVLSWHGFFTF